ncbi:lipopolysaccharide modification acyltransferase, partial [mine drainage metagenome]
LLTRRTWVLLPLLIVLALSLPYTREALNAHPIWREKAYLPGMAAIATGMIGALIAARFKPSNRALSWTLAILGGAGVLGMLTTERFVWPVIGDWDVFLLTFSTMCLLIGLQWSRVAGSNRPWPALGWLRSMGRHSYEIYLSHMFVVFGAVALFRSLDASMHLGWAWYIPIILLCWGLGLLVARYFSVPCDRVLRAYLLRNEKRRALEGSVAAPPG